MTALTGPRFPWGTLLINVLGSGIIGLVAAVTLAPARVAMHPDLRVFLMVGMCGGFTTFSAFSLQTLELLQAGEYWICRLLCRGLVCCPPGGWWRCGVARWLHGPRSIVPRLSFTGP